MCDKVTQKTKRRAAPYSVRFQDNKTLWQDGIITPPERFHLAMLISYIHHNYDYCTAF